MKNYFFLYPLLISLTLGLAPYSSEPHIIGKLRWLKRGAVEMESMDYFDALLHGFPWIWLAFSLFQ